MNILLERIRRRLTGHPVQRHRGVRVIIFGTHSKDWLDALEPDAPVWSHLPGVDHVLQIDADHALPPADHGVERTVVVPLLEHHIANRPETCASLVPDRRALHTLGNKAAFAAYVLANGLASLCPETYADVDSATYPCVLKRVDLNAGVGVQVVFSERECRALLQQDPWRGHPYLLQSFVAEEGQSVTHGVCRDGRIVWDCTYDYDPADPTIVRNRGRRIRRGALPASRRAEFESLLAPLSYSGPCCIDYKVTNDHRTRVLEINPRFGGSLMRPDNTADLAAALTTIITLALEREALLSKTAFTNGNM